ncbi:hypothetical protein [Clostridium sp. DL1XJH146]
MVINSLISLAIKNGNGEYRIVTLSVFEIEKLQKEFDELYIIRNNYNEVIIKIKCMLCGEDHTYKYKIRNFMSKTINICGCEKLGIPIIIIGKRDEIKSRVKKYEEVNKKVSEILKTPYV